MSDEPKQPTDLTKGDNGPRPTHLFESKTDGKPQPINYQTMPVSAAPPAKPPAQQAKK